MVTSKLTDKQKDFRKEVSRLNSMANKRIMRMEKSTLGNSPAYDKWKESGGTKFSIRGKTQQEVRREYYRVKQFVDSKTSSITGTKKVLVNMAENTGIEYKSIEDLKASSKAFFELSSKVDQYLNTTSKSSSAVSYQRIWTAINQYTQSNDIKMRSQNVDGLIDVVAELSEQLLERDNRTTSDFFNIDWKNLN